MRSPKGIYAVLLCLVCILSSCSITRRVPEGSYLLMWSDIKEDKSAPKDERLRSEEVEVFIRQQPNRRFLGTNLYLQLYNLARPGSDKWFSRTMRKWGEAPVLLDTNMVKQSAAVIEDYTHKRGFYDSQNSFGIDTTRRNKKAFVTYTLKQNEPYSIGKMNYFFRDDVLRSVILQDTTNSLIHAGDILNSYVLSAEKTRITNHLKDRGYYYFKLDNIEFLGDSTVGDRKVNVNMIVRQALVGYTPAGAPIYENNRVYRYRNVFITPAYDPIAAASDPDYLSNTDTVQFRGLNIIKPIGERANVRRKVLRNFVNMYPNTLYSSSEVQETYTNMMRLGYFRNTRVIFDSVPSTGAASELTFIGSDDGNVSQATTYEGYLDCRIYATPALKHSYKIEVEGTTSSNFYGLNAAVGYQNRNLLRGVEVFDISLRGGYEFMKVTGQKGAFEIGGSTSLSFPRFIAPFRVDRYNRLGNPRTKVEMSYNVQRRPVYRRALSGINWGYSWTNRKNSSFTFRPIDVNYVDVWDIQEDFWDKYIGNNDYLRNSYSSQLIIGMSGSYVYNSQLMNSLEPKSFLLRFNWETMGNTMWGLSHLFGSKEYLSDTGDKYYKLFGIRYAQYIRGDVSVSDRVNLGPRVVLAGRLYAGAAWAYGNGQAMPFDRMFFAGGTNSMRGWASRALGPGNTLLEKNPDHYQRGDMKLEANLELRFPVWSILNGALFFDTGNVWMLKDRGNGEDAVFKANRFYRQLGFNTGLGARFDISMLVIRFDWGVQLHNPNRPKGERWINKFHFDNTAFNFGVGYPF